MTVFSREVEVIHDLDFLLLRNCSITKYYQENLLNEDIKCLLEKGYVVYKFDCDVENLNVLHKSIKKILNFPSYYEKANLDTFSDLLADFFRLLDIKNSGVVFVFNKFDLLNKKFPEHAWNLLDILEQESRYNLLFGLRFITLLHVGDPNLVLKPIGSVPIQWDRKEWLNSARER